MHKNQSTGLTRRAFLPTLGIGLGAGIWRPLPLGAAAKPDTKPRVTFVQINDLHVQEPGTDIKGYKSPNEKAKWVVQEINRQPPDLVLGIGDMIHGQRLDQLPKDLAIFREIIKPLQVPFYPTMGNHEDVQREGDTVYEKAYRDVFGDQRVSYTFEAGGVRFIMLNNSGATGASPEIIGKRNAWLREVLKTHPGQPKILGCHIPIVPVRDEPVLAKSFGFKSYIAHDPELLALVDAHADSIIMVLSGHLHLTGQVERKGVRHISICGTASYPNDFARYQVFDDRIVMQVRQLPLAPEETTPSLHGQPRHKMDFTDATHESAELYKMGRNEERNLTIWRKKA